MLADFFDVRPGPVEVNPMFGPAHLAAIAVLPAIVIVMVTLRGRLREVPIDAPAVQAISAFILGDQVFLFVLYFVYDYQPFWERFPLHLCAGLSLFVPAMHLAGKLSAVRYIGVWAIGSGLISVVNMSLTHNPVGSYVFVHYMWMHYYLFGFPIFLAVRGDFRPTYRELLRSVAGLLAISAAVFVIDWTTGANYMYIGPGSTLEIPFLPDPWLVWPSSYPTFIAVALALFHVIFLALRLAPASARAR